MHKELRGDTARTAAPLDLRDIPDHMGSFICSAYKAGGGEAAGGYLE